MDTSNVAVMFAAAAAVHANRPATRVRSGDGWTVQTYAELEAQVRGLAARLIIVGLAPG